MKKYYIHRLLNNPCLINMNIEKINLDWTLSVLETSEGPVALEDIPAKVPGAVQLDIAAHKGWEPHFFGENWKQYLEYEDKYYRYSARFDKPLMNPEQTVAFVSKGIDYEYTVFLNNQELLRREGMFSYLDLDVTSYLRDKGNLLEILVFPAPKSHQGVLDRTQANECVKPAVSYSWDWHPRLVPLGIWDDTFLQIRSKQSILSANHSYTFEDKELKEVKLNVCVNTSEKDTGYIKWSLIDGAGKVVADIKLKIQDNRSMLVKNIKGINLWWPHDHGSPYLYTSRIQVFEDEGYGNCISEREQKIGFRKTELRMNTGSWDEPSTFPKSRSMPPIALTINNKRIFAKGSNFVNPEIFPGKITGQTYLSLLELAKEANFNILRIWGGGIVNKESFHELCDEMGIMVWQEFPLSCNDYSSKERYLSVLEQEATAIIGRLRQHPSTVLWCGGNELFNNWSGMTDQSLALRLLNSLCLKHDPYTPFIPTSPIAGMGHGHYVFRDNELGQEVYEWMNKSQNTAYTEFGISSPSSTTILESIIPEEELWPPKEGTSWESHHAFNAWIGDTWLRVEMLQHYFREIEGLDDLVEKGQLIQAEGLKYIYEEARRQKPYCSMVLNWCYNEPWPTAANCSIINYPDIPKRAFYEVSKACRPFLLSARLFQFMYAPDENLKAELWVLNDSYDAVRAGEVTVYLRMGDSGKRLKLLTWVPGECDPDTNIQGPVINVPMASGNDGFLTLELESSLLPEMNSQYVVYLRTETLEEAERSGVLNM